jgi:hypothetical protein
LAQQPFALAFIFALAVGPACDTPTEPTRVARAVPRPTAAVTISGRVSEYSTNAATARARVGFGDLNFSGRFVANAEATTDAAGSYVLTIQPGSYLAAVDGQVVGSVHLVDASVSGDLLINPGRCVARYGVITDPRSHRPIEGVRVTLASRTVTSGSDGAYRIDLGCSGPLGFNTTSMYFDYGENPRDCTPVGRGIDAVERIDMFLGGRGLSRFC